MSEIHVPSPSGEPHHTPTPQLPSASAPNSSPLAQVNAPSAGSEERLHTLYNAGEFEQLKTIPRSEITALLRTTKHFETALLIMSSLKHAENPEEVNACLRLVEVERTPSLTLSARVGAFFAELIGNNQKWNATFPEFRGPKIWPGHDNNRPNTFKFLDKATEHARCPGTENFMGNGRGRQSMGATSYTKAVLAVASQMLRGVPEAQLPLARLAVNLFSEKSGLKGDSLLVATIMENAFPGEVELSPYSVFTGRHRAATKWTRYYNSYRKECGLKPAEGKEFPAAPEGLDSREKRQFTSLLARYLASPVNGI